MRKDYETEIEELTQQVSALTMSLEKMRDEKEYSSQRSGEEMQSLKRQMTQKDDGTAQILMKFQDELAKKEKQLTELQASSKKKITDLETQTRKDLKKSAAEIAKLNSKLNKQESLAAKYFGVESELVSLRSQILTKDNEINKLKRLMSKSGSAIQEETSDMEEEDSPKAARPAKKKGPPSPD